MFLLVFVLTVLCFGFVSIIFFKQRSKNSLSWNGLKYLSLIFWISMIYEVSNYKQTLFLLELAASLICLSSLVLYCFTYLKVKKEVFGLAYNKDTPPRIIMSGPFSFMRHPFYSSYLLCYFSLIIFNFNSYTLFGFLSFLFIYYNATLDEENIILKSSLKEEYLNYQSRTPRFLPFFKAISTDKRKNIKSLKKSA